MKSINAMQLKMASTPKSCLAKHDDPRNGDVDETDCSSLMVHHPKLKRVVFADDKGLELTQVKIMSEPSNVPPYWTLQFLAEVTHGLISPVAVTEQWVVDFKQPASDYLEFRCVQHFRTVPWSVSLCNYLFSFLVHYRRMLEEHNVSLENVIVRESESLVVGTVKVKNLSFDKEVIVRVTYDQWKSQEDIQCTYSSLSGPGAGGAYALFDTFSFKLTLPPSSKRSVEFCVCFRCNGQEYWDSNNVSIYHGQLINKNETIGDSLLNWIDFLTRVLCSRVKTTHCPSA